MWFIFKCIFVFSVHSFIVWFVIHHSYFLADRTVASRMISFGPDTVV